MEVSENFPTSFYFAMLWHFKYLLTNPFNYFRYIFQAFTSWQVWISTMYYYSIVTPLYGVGLFLPTIINSFGTYTRPQVQLLTIPVYVVACTYVIGTAVLGDRYKKRFVFVFFDQCLCLIGFTLNSKYFWIFGLQTTNRVVVNFQNAC